MVELFSGYVRNIAIFIIFMTLIELMLPNHKYKPYITLISGFLLLFIMLMPIQSLLQNIGTGFGQNPFDISLELDKSIMQKERAYYAKEQKEIIMEAYKEQLAQQVENLVNQSTDFRFESCEVILIEEEEYFGEIAKLLIEVQENEKEKPLIRIEKVKVNIGTGQTNEEATENEKVKILKKSILDFYNLSEAHIDIKAS